MDIEGTVQTVGSGAEISWKQMEQVINSGKHRWGAEAQD